jgi:L-iditol 2-dehydrogenase
VKALVLTRSNFLEFVDVRVPEIGRDEVLVKVSACGICGSDVHGMDGSSGRRVPPVIMGHEAAGVIAETGNLVRDWQPGQRVTFDSTIYCGKCSYCQQGLVNLCDNRRVLGVSCDDYRQDGAFAEYVAVPSRILYPLPDGVSFVQGATVEPLSIAVHAVSLARTPPDSTAVVIGCGVIGLLIVQVLRALGSLRVIAVDVDPYRLQQAVEMGAEASLRSDRDDVASKITRMTSGRGADVVFEAVGINATVNLATDLTRKGGTVVLVGNITPVVDLPLQKVVTRQLTVNGSAASCGEYPVSIGLIADGKVTVDAIVSAVAPLSEGPDWFARLRRGGEPLLKVMLEP